MVPEWMVPSPRDVPTQCNNEPGPKYFNSGVELIFRQSWNFLAFTRSFRMHERRPIVTGATTCRHGTDASSTRSVPAARHKTFLCGGTLRLRVPGVVTQ